MYEYYAKVLNVVDGDTFDLDVDLGFKIHHQIRVRLLNIDTPETRTTDPIEKKYGNICKEIAREIFLDKNVIIKSVKGLDIYTDSFGRYLVDIRLADEDENCIAKYNKYGMNKLNVSTYNFKSIENTAKLYNIDTNKLYKI